MIADNQTIADKQPTSTIADSYRLETPATADGNKNEHYYVATSSPIPIVGQDLYQNVKKRLFSQVHNEDNKVNFCQPRVVSELSFLLLNEDTSSLSTSKTYKNNDVRVSIDDGSVSSLSTYGDFTDCCDCWEADESFIPKLNFPSLKSTTLNVSPNSSFHAFRPRREYQEAWDHEHVEKIQKGFSNMDVTIAQKPKVSVSPFE